MPNADNKRIAKNTLFLYGRMLFLTLINLYTFRITLNALGVENYGIYNVVGSFVALFSVLTAPLTSATQRFLSFNLGERDYAGYSKTFSLFIIGFLAIGMGILVMGEIAGLFIFDGFLKIPPSNIYAAKWILQTSLATFLVYLITIPYTSSIVANEKMSAFAYISIVDGLLKLGLVFLLLAASHDRLILYGILTLTESIIILVLYVIYCHRKIQYCRFKLIWDKDLFKKLTAYTGWNLLGSLSGTLASQGQSILLNIFFGPVINAAKGIADKVYNVVYSLCSNFYLAVSPQIVKSYANNDLERMRTLAIRSSKFSFLLLYIVSFPLMVTMPYILVIWLGADGRTEDTVGFARLVLLKGLLMSLEPPITHMIRATGEIKQYQIRVGLLMLMYIPIAWLSLKIFGNPLLTMWVLIGVVGLTQLIRIWQAKNQVDLSVKEYWYAVILPIIRVSVVSIPLFYMFLHIRFASELKSITYGGLGCLILSIVISWLLGINRDERKVILKMIYQKLRLTRKSDA